MSNEFKLVPARILLDKNVIGAINFHCGDGDGQFGDYVDGELWVGILIDDDGKEVYGLHLLTSEYPEEGSTTLAEFAAPQPPALGGDLEALGSARKIELLREESLPVLYVRQQDLDWAQKAKAEISMGARYAPLNEYTVGLIDRTHLAPLQAEIESERALRREMAVRVHQLNDEVKDLTGERDQLKARCDELEALLREVVSLDPRGEFMGWQLDGRIDNALSKPAGSEQV